MKDIPLVISRKKEYWDLVRPYKIYVDGSYAGSLMMGQTKMFLIREGKHIIKIKQALSISRSKEYHIDGTAASPVYLEVSTSWLGTSGNLVLLFFLLFISLSDYYSWLFNLIFTYLLHFTLLYGGIVFFVLAGRYIVVKPSKNPAV